MVVVCVVYLSSFERCFRTAVVCIVVRLEFVSCSVMVSGFVQMFVVFLVLFNVVCFLKMGGCLCIVSLYCGCDEYCDFCLICDACSLRCSWSVCAVCLCPACILLQSLMLGFV